MAEQVVVPTLQSALSTNLPKKMQNVHRAIFLQTALHHVYFEISFTKMQSIEACALKTCHM